MFVVGTDTGTGKTIATAAIVCGLKSHGVKTAVMKPVETGIATSAVSDSDWLIAVTGCEAQLELIAPYRLQIPAAPLVAADAEGTTINPSRIMTAFGSLSDGCDCVLIEGVGGIMVPLTGDLLLVDLIRVMRVPVLLIARTSLGSINHSLLTVECLRTRGISVLGILFNNPVSPEKDSAVQRTIPTILRFTGLQSFGELPYCEGLPNTWEQHRERLLAQINLEGLMEVLGLRGAA